MHRAQCGIGFDFDCASGRQQAIALMSAQRQPVQVSSDGELRRMLL
jgi:hypothetical protein